MKKALIIVVLLIFFPLLSRADFNISQWKYVKEIKNFGGEVTKFTLDDEIFSLSNKNLSDIRIIDGSGKEVPFIMLTGKAEEGKVSYPVKMINNSFVVGKDSSVILDLGGRGKITNNLLISTNSQNFQRNVKISGSDDMSNWSVLKDNAYIYDYTDKKANVQSKNTSLSFPDSVFQFLKIEIADEGNNPVKISSVSAYQNKSASVRESVRKINFSREEDIERKTTDIISDMGLDGVPVSKITIKTKDDNFNRGVVIYSSSNRNDWKLLGQGYIFRYNTLRFVGENSTVQFPETNDRYLKIEIMNKDNSPLVIEELSIYSIYREIAFQPQKESTYKIYYGNQKAGYPQYDLEKYFQYLDMDGARIASLSPQSLNASFVPEKEPTKPLSERIPYLFPAIIVFASLILLALVYRFLKSN